MHSVSAPDVVHTARRASGSPAAHVLARAGLTPRGARAFGRLALGHPEQSPFAQVPQGKRFRIRFGQKVRFELDGGARPASKKLNIKVRPSSVTVCVPARRCSGRRPDGWLE
jgi:diacylglycerol kinase family enzyme